MIQGNASHTEPLQATDTLIRCDETNVLGKGTQTGSIDEGE